MFFCDRVNSLVILVLFLVFVLIKNEVMFSISFIVNRKKVRYSFYLCRSDNIVFIFSGIYFMFILILGE